MVETISTVSSGISTALDVVSSVLEVLTPILTLGDLPALDVGQVVRLAIDALISDLYNGSINAFHFFPTSQWKIYTYRSWLQLAEKTILENPTIFTPSTDLLVWLIEAEDPDSLLNAVSPIIELFGQAPIELEPETITRDPLADYITDAQTSRPIDVIPGLRDLADSLDLTADSFGAPADFSAMASQTIDLLKKKSEQLTARVQTLENAIAALEAIASISIKRGTIAGQATPQALADALKACDNAPGQTVFVSASMFAYDQSISAFVESLL